MNVISDLYLISIPLPMLWSTTLKPLRKMGLMLIFSGGLLVVACALLRSVLMLTVRIIPFLPETFLYRLLKHFCPGS